MIAAPDEFDFIATLDCEGEPTARDFCQMDLGGDGHADRSRRAMTHIDVGAHCPLILERYDFSASLQTASTKATICAVAKTAGMSRNA